MLLQLLRGNLKMGDFGIAKVLECTAACAQTQIGTPYYLSPEICSGAPCEESADFEQDFVTASAARDYAKLNFEMCSSQLRAQSPLIST